MSLRSLTRLSLVAALAAPAIAQAQKPATFLEYTTTVPAAWASRTPASSMRLAEYVTSQTSGTGAEVIVYYFGKGQGGSPTANLDRWKGQFSNPDGGPIVEKVSNEKLGDIALTIAEYRGTYARAVGQGSSAEDARPNHILIAVVAETPRGTLFFQCFGPVASVESARASYLAFVRGLK
jgi:hypothetical protein